MMETVFTLNEVAQFLKISPRAVRRLATKGEIPGRKIGNQWRFSLKAVQSWLGGEDIPLSAKSSPHQERVETLLIELSRLLSKMISEQERHTPSESEKFYGLSGVEKKTGNPHLDFFGCLASNPLAKEVEDFIQAEKERQRQLAQLEEI